MLRIFQWTTQYHEVFVGESVHEYCVLGPPFLLSHLPFSVPRRSLLLDHYEVPHFPTLAGAYREARKDCLNGFDEGVSGLLPAKTHYFPN